MRDKEKNSGVERGLQDEEKESSFARTEIKREGKFQWLGPSAFYVDLKTGETKLPLESGTNPVDRQKLEA